MSVIGCLSGRFFLKKRFTPEPAQEPASRIVASGPVLPPPTVGSRKHVIIHGTRFHTTIPSVNSQREAEVASRFCLPPILALFCLSLSPKRLGRSQRAVKGQRWHQLTRPPAWMPPAALPPQTLGGSQSRLAERPGRGAGSVRAGGWVPGMLSALNREGRLQGAPKTWETGAERPACVFLGQGGESWCEALLTHSAGDDRGEGPLWALSRGFQGQPAPVWGEATAIHAPASHGNLPWAA